MSPRYYLLFSGLLGILTGLVTTHSLLVHSWTSMILWAAVGIVILWLSADKKVGIRAGTLFATITALTWLVSGYQGSSGQLGGFAILVVIGCAIGALVGYVGSLLFFAITRRR